MFNKLFRVLLVITAAVCLWSTAALAAGPPDPATSTVDNCLVMCPAGDVSFTVTVRDATGAPCPGVWVAIDFCPCTEAILCKYAGGQVCNNGKNDLLLTTADASGVAVFQPAGGGTCGGVPVDIVASGVVLAQRVIRPLDVNGNFVVDPADMTLHGVWNDYNCDGAADLIDIAFFNQHIPHSCDAPVGDEKHSWGDIKSLWR